MTHLRDRIAGSLSRQILKLATVDLDGTIRMLLLNYSHELAKPVGEQDPDIAELAAVYEQLTGWTVAQDLADHPNPWETS